MGFRLIKQQQHKFVFKVEGDAHDMDAENLGDILTSLAELAAFVKNVGFPESEASIRINATKKGSFEIESAVVLTVVPNLITTFFQSKEIVGAELLFQSIIELFDYKRFLQDKKLADVSISNSPGAIVCKDGSSVNVLNVNLAANFLENPSADKAITRLCNAITDNGQDGFSVFDSTKVFRASSDDCKSMSSEIIAPQTLESEFEEERTANVQLRKPDLVGDSKWSFIYLGQTISAKMHDKDFVSKVQSGQVTLSKNSKFVVRMRVRIGNDKKGRPTINSYEILEVFDDQ